MSASPRVSGRRASRASASSTSASRASASRTIIRRGNTVPFVLISAVVAAVLAFGGWWVFGGSGTDETPEFLTTTVSHGPYDFVVIEQGTVESATNVELRCQVRSRGGGGGGGDRGSSGLGGSS